MLIFKRLFESFKMSQNIDFDEEDAAQLQFPKVWLPLISFDKWSLCRSSKKQQLLWTRKWKSFLSTEWKMTKADETMLSSRKFSKRRLTIAKW